MPLILIAHQPSELFADTVASAAKKATICPVPASVTVVDKFGISSMVVLVVVSPDAVSHPFGKTAASILLLNDDELTED